MKDIVLNKHAFNFEKFDYPEGTQMPTSVLDKTNSFILPHGGSVEIKTEKIHIMVNTGDIAFVPPGLKGNITYSPNSYGNLLQFMYWPDVDDFAFPLQKLKIDEELGEYINALPNFDDNVDSNFIWRAYQFLDIVQAHLLENTSKDTKKIQKAIIFMRENDNYSIPDLAKLCNMSESRFYSVFNEVVGMTPIKMKHKIQTTKAEFLLKSTDLSIDEIAHKIGFESTAHFRKVFNDHYGFSPKEMRKNYRLY